MQLIVIFLDSARGGAAAARGGNIGLRSTFLMLDHICIDADEVRQDIDREWLHSQQTNPDTHS